MFESYLIELCVKRFHRRQISHIVSDKIFEVCVVYLHNTVDTKVYNLLMCYSGQILWHSSAMTFARSKNRKKKKSYIVCMYEAYMAAFVCTHHYNYYARKKRDKDHCEFVMEWCLREITDRQSDG